MSTTQFKSWTPKFAIKLTYKITCGQKTKIKPDSFKPTTIAGEVLSPVPIALGAPITNTGRAPVTLDDIAVEVRNGRWGKWERLSSISVDGGLVYSISDPRSAIPLDFHGLD
jgi:hypothetical protein